MDGRLTLAGIVASNRIMDPHSTHSAVDGRSVNFVWNFCFKSDNEMPRFSRTEGEPPTLFQLSLDPHSTRLAVDGRSMLTGDLALNLVMRSLDLAGRPHESTQANKIKGRARGLYGNQDM